MEDGFLVFLLMALLVATLVLPPSFTKTKYGKNWYKT